jgi:hypothetical protein
LPLTGAAESATIVYGEKLSKVLYTEVKTGMLFDANEFKKSQSLQMRFLVESSTIQQLKSAAGKSKLDDLE